MCNIVAIIYFCRMKINWDALGISASLACAIHCALLPLFLTSLPVLGIEIIHNAAFEYSMIAVAAAIGFYSLLHGYVRHHHQFFPVIIFAIGIACLFAKQIWHSHELLFLIPAVTLIVAAHFVNYRACKAANHCHASDCGH